MVEWKNQEPKKIVVAGVNQKILILSLQVLLKNLKRRNRLELGIYNIAYFIKRCFSKTRKVQIT